MAQGVLPFQYQTETSPLTSFAGLPLYLDLAYAIGLRELLDTQIAARSGSRGYSDAQVCQAVILTQLAGGSCVEDVERLEGDAGLTTLLRNVLLHGLRGKKRRAMRSRLDSGRAIPTASSVQRYLDSFHDADWEKDREDALESGIKAFIPEPVSALKGLYKVNAAAVAFLQKHAPQAIATLDMDATLIETGKKDARFCYKHFPAYQPLQTYWAEQGVLLHSEFRDGNVPAGYEQKRVLEESLDMLPEGVTKVRLRSDTAGYQWDLLKYCAEGKNERFGVIDFAVGADVTSEFKKEVARVKETNWKPLFREVNGRRIPSGQEWAEVVYVPSILSFSKSGPDYRFIAVRELLPEQAALPGLEPVQQELPFPTIELPRGGDLRRYKLTALVSNRWDLSGPALIAWLRERCGKSEEIHAILKDDLAGGTLPSGKFGANAAWWSLTVLALTLHRILARLALGERWETRRMKAMRYHLIGLAGRVVKTGRRLMVRVEEEAIGVLIRARAAIQSLLFADTGG